jgi:hypothetical protein
MNWATCSVAPSALPRWPSRAGAKGSEWGKAAEEKFARGFERYLRDGTAPNKPLQKIFGKMRDWLRGIYESITGSAIDIKITPEIRALFDRMLTPKDAQQSQVLDRGIQEDATRSPAAVPRAQTVPEPSPPAAQAPVPRGTRSPRP